MRKHKALWIVGIVFAVLFLSCGIGLNRYSANQEKFAVDAHARVLRALDNVDYDATALRMRSQLRDEIGEDYRIEKLVYYVSPSPNCAYIDGVAVADGRRYSFRYFFMGKKIVFSGGFEQETVDAAPPTKP